MAEKKVAFCWDDEGGLHVQHDDQLNLADLTQGLAALCYIVAANIYRLEGRAELDDALTQWADERLDRGRIAEALSIVLVDYEVMLPHEKTRQGYRHWVQDSVGALGDALMAAWDDYHEGKP